MKIMDVCYHKIIGEWNSCLITGRMEFAATGAKPAGAGLKIRDEEPMIDNTQVSVRDTRMPQQQLELSHRQIYDRLQTTPELLSQFCKKWQISELALLGSIHPTINFNLTQLPIADYP